MENINVIGSGSLETLQPGDVLLVEARKVAGGKIQLEFAEIIVTADATPNVLAIFNQSDERFSGAGARRAWLTAEPKDAGANLGLDLSDANENWTTNAKGQEVLQLNVLAPKAIVGSNTFDMKVEVAETVVPSAYQALNIETAAKRKGKDGEFILHNGQHIFANTRIAFNKANHVFLTADATPAPVSANAAGVASVFNGLGKS